MGRVGVSGVTVLMMVGDSVRDDERVVVVVVMEVVIMMEMTVVMVGWYW